MILELMTKVMQGSLTNINFFKFYININFIGFW